MPWTKNNCKFLVLICLIAMYSCKSSNDEKVVRGVSEINRLMLSKKFEYDTLMKFLKHFDESFEHKLQQNTQSEMLNTRVNYFWNSDSSIAMIKSYKMFSQGFKRELALSIKDADNKHLLFVYMFQVQKDSSNYAFIETFDYLSSSEVSKALAKVEFSGKEIIDTVKFRERPFNDLTLETQNNYLHWLDYWRNVVDYN